MPTLAEIRQQFPQYGDMTDSALGDALYSKFYSDIPRNEFNAKVGLAPTAAPAQSVPGGLNVDAAPAPAPAGGEVATASGGGSAVGRVASKAAEVASSRFGDQPFGISEQSVKELRGTGALAQEGAAPTTLQALNEIVYKYGSKAGDLALRAIAAGIGGIQGAAEQTAVELGADPSTGKRLARDVGMLADTAGIVAGTGPAPTRAPRAAAVAERPLTGEVLPPSRGLPAAEAAATGADRVVIPSPAGAAEFKAASQSFYKAAEDANVLIKNDSYAGLAADVFQTAAKNRLDPTLTPGSTAAVKRISELADPRTGPISFETLDTMRQIAGDARQAAKAGSNDARVAGLIVDKIDAYVAQLSSKDVIAGDARVAADTIVKARDLWSRAAKLDTVAGLVDRATTSAGQFSGSGFENALRTEFRSLAKSKERMRTFSADEQKAIKIVARGSVGGNVARFVGKLAPTGVVSGGVSLGAGASVGSALLGPGLGTAIGAATFGTAGLVGRAVATALTKRSIARLEDVIRTKGESPMAMSALGRGQKLLTALQEGQSAALPAAAAPKERR